jgi:hypothetical protein
MLPRTASAFADYPFAAGAGGTGRMISDATFQSRPTFIQLIIIKNGLGVPACPAYETVIFIGAGRVPRGGVAGASAGRAL